MPPIEVFPSETPVISIELTGMQLDLPSGAIAVWQDGTVRFECPVNMSDVRNSTMLRPTPAVHRATLSTDRIRALMLDLEHRGAFARTLPKEHGGEDAADCGWWIVELHSGDKTAHLDHWGCATPTTLYLDTMKNIAGLIDSAPCGLRCELLGAGCDRH